MACHLRANSCGDTIARLQFKVQNSCSASYLLGGVLLWLKGILLLSPLSWKLPWGTEGIVAGWWSCMCRSLALPSSISVMAAKLLLLSCPWPSEVGKVAFCSVSTSMLILCRSRSASRSRTSVSQAKRCTYDFVSVPSGLDSIRLVAHFYESNCLEFSQNISSKCTRDTQVPTRKNVWSCQADLTYLDIVDHSQLWSSVIIKWQRTQGSCGIF